MSFCSIKLEAEIYVTVHRWFVTNREGDSQTNISNQTTRKKIHWKDKEQAAGHPV